MPIRIDGTDITGVTEIQISEVIRFQFLQLNVFGSIYRTKEVSI